MASTNDKAQNGGNLNYILGKLRTWITSLFQTRNVGTAETIKSKAMVTDSNGNISVSSITAAELGYLSNLTGNVQSQLDGRMNKNITIADESGASEINTDRVALEAGKNVSISWNVIDKTVVIEAADAPTASTTESGGSKTINKGVIGVLLPDYTLEDADDYDPFAPALYQGQLAIRIANSTDYGVAKLGSDVPQTVAAQDVTSTTGRTYSVQKNREGQLVVNVPWHDTDYTLPAASTSVRGGVRVGAGLELGGDDNDTINVCDVALEYDSEDLEGVYFQDVKNGTLYALSLPYGSTSSFGLVKAGVNISVSGGVISIPDAGASKGVMYLYGELNSTTYQKTDGTLTVNAINTELSRKANLASPAFTGYPTAANSPTSDNGIATKGYVDSAIGGITGIEYRTGFSSLADLQTKVPTGSKGVIYLVTVESSGNNLYDQYIWVINKYERIGDTRVDLTNYVTFDDFLTEEEIDQIFANNGMNVA